MRLSIIIPVYNVEKYIEDCICSCIDCISSDSSDIEVIIVDDGSPDKSMDIVHKLICDIPYFKVITQVNQGLSIARNNGLEIAIGDYVWFVDSDDFIRVGIIDVILDTINTYKGIDIIELSHKKVEEFINRQALPQIKREASVMKMTSGQERVLTGFSSPVQFHVFRRAFLNQNKLRMYPGIYHEDGEFTPRALWSSNQVIIIPDVAYYYRQRSNSIMHSVNPKKGEDSMFVAYRLKEYFDSQHVERKERRVIDNFISMAFCNGLHNAIGATKDDLKRIASASFKYRTVLESLKNSTKLKYVFLGYFASLFPQKIVNIYLFMMLFNISNRKVIG